MTDAALRTGNYYNDCRDWLRIDLDRKMVTYRGCRNYSPDLVRINLLCEMHGFTPEMIRKAAELGIIKAGKKYRARDKYANLYDGNEVALRVNEIEKLRGQV